jgi:hypothetical protein
VAYFNFSTWAPCPRYHRGKKAPKSCPYCHGTRQIPEALFSSAVELERKTREENRLADLVAARVLEIIKKKKR